MDERQRRRVRIGGEKQIEPLARGVAIGKIKMAGNFAPHPGAACGPVGDNRVALRDRRGVVVGGIELGTVHSAVHHGAAPVAIRWTWAVGQSATHSAAAVEPPASTGGSAAANFDSAGRHPVFCE